MVGVPAQLRMPPEMGIMAYITTKQKQQILTLYIFGWQVHRHQSFRLSRHYHTLWQSVPVHLLNILGTGRQRPPVDNERPLTEGPPTTS